ncbi:diguanylate cyclase [Marinobacteraceae bacterium S3BR75-40.1]
MAQITFDTISDAVLAVDTKGLVVYLNKTAEKLTGWSREEAKGHPVEQVFFIFDDTIGARVQSPAHRAISEDRAVKLALGSVLIRRDGTGIAIEDSAIPIRNRHGTMTGAVIVFHDARQSRSALRKMSHHAQHDYLTGLPNRMLMMERLTQAIGLAHRHRKQIALLFMDLDNFKQINDSLGHSVGDALLKDIAVEIGSCVRSTDTVSRHGGDEFVVLLSEIEAPEDALQVAEKLLARFAEPRKIEGHEVQATLSIGISVYPEDGHDATTLMGNADAAMYATKESGRNGYRFFQQAN